MVELPPFERRSALGHPARLPARPRTESGTDMAIWDGLLGIIVEGRNHRAFEHRTYAHYRVRGARESLGETTRIRDAANL